jgi:Alkylmercury lyase
MLLFRSERHIDQWCEKWRRPRGGTLGLEQAWNLARAWYGNRLEPEFRPFTRSEAQAVFAQVGLQGPFWDLPPELDR